MISVKNISSLEKILPCGYISAPEFNEYTCLRGEKFSYQIAFKGETEYHPSEYLEVNVKSDLKDVIEICETGFVTVTTPAFCEEFDNNYITRAPGIIPDILTPINGTVAASCSTYRTLWVTVNVPETAEAGLHEITVTFEGADSIIGESVFKLKVIDASLPKQELMFTQWFYCDCISSFYGVEPLSERHWVLIDKFMKMAAENGVNMILTPIFTPALDTKIGSERPTVQLVDVSFKDDIYEFGFEKLDRWLDMCAKNGIEYIEIAHLCSQWGAEKTPKIVVEENGEKIKKFGWHTDSLSNEYKYFISQLLPRLTAHLKEKWDSKKIYFHISDEPNEAHLERYGEIYKFVKPYLDEFNLMDALSNYEFYEKGYVDTPVASTIYADDFTEHDVENLWVYYCCGEGKFNLSNRFIAMPSYRNRIIGAQLYKYDIKGFLHWGYNFYYSRLSTKLINPYLSNDSDYGFPAGDAFSVYPGFDGPLASLRLVVFGEALSDLRAMRLAEQLAGKDAVMNIIEENTKITFREYPASADYILNMRAKINALIEEFSK